MQRGIAPEPSKKGTGSSSKFEVGPVSVFMLARAVEIDASWNPRPWSERLFVQEIRNPSSRVRGVYVNDELVGYLIAHVVMDEAHIVSLGVDPDWRGRGAASALMKEFLRYCAAQRVFSLTLEVRVSNIAAQGLYQKFGFVTAGIRRKYYSSNGEDALNMRLSIDR